jgi:hypothetical protein
MIYQPFPAPGPNQDISCMMSSDFLAAHRQRAERLVAFAALTPEASRQRMTVISLTI